MSLEGKDWTLGQNLHVGDIVIRLKFKKILFIEIVCTLYNAK